MKTILFLCAVVAVVVARPEFYSDQYDNFNAQELVENIRLLKNYGKCFLDEGPCTSEGTNFKSKFITLTHQFSKKQLIWQDEIVRIPVY